jgi:D-alanyl-D-alanine carboxypeptidase
MSIRCALLLASSVAAASCAVIPQEQSVSSRQINSAADQAALQAILDQHLPRLVAEHKIPGAAVAAARKEGIAAHGAAGVRSMELPEPLTAGDAMHVGSLAKPMLATLIATLVQEGRLSWDTLVLDVFPDWRETAHPRFHELSLEQLLTHRSGISQFISGEEWNEVPDLTGSEAERRRGFAQWIINRPPQFTPGEFHYSNAGYGIATAVVEKVTGKDWWTLMQERLFGPLGIRSAGRGWPYTSGPHHPLGHWWRESRFVPQGPDDPYQIGTILAPGGNLHMSIGDLARFAQLHLQGLQGRDGFLRSETIRRMHQPAKGANYALGWYSDSGMFDEPHSRHTGEVGTFHARIWIFPQRDLAITAVTNADTEAAYDVTSEIFQRLRLVLVARASSNGSQTR